MSDFAGTRYDVGLSDIEIDLPAVQFSLIVVESLDAVAARF